MSASTSVTAAGVVVVRTGVSAPSLAPVAGSARFDDVAMHRAEMEEAKRENERLRTRIVELEAALKERRGERPRGG
jgi:hypothetical protein